MDRRKALHYAAKLGMSMSALSLLGCASAADASGTPSTGTIDNGSCGLIPEETAGPYPALERLHK